MQLKSLLKFIIVFLSLSLTPVFSDPLDSPAEQLAWASFRNLTPDRYQELVDDYSARGYRVVDFEVNVEERRLRSDRLIYSVVFRKNPESRGWVLRSNLSNQEYRELWQRMRDRDYRLIDQESFTYNGEQRYGGLWIQNREGLDSRSNRNMTYQGLLSRNESYANQGLMPIDIEAYYREGNLNYAGVWVENKNNDDWILEPRTSSSQFNRMYTLYTRRGYRLVDNNAFQQSGRLYFASIWVRDSRSNAPRVLARRNMDSRSFNNWWNRFRDRGYRLENVERYETSSGTRYLGIWVENNRTLSRWEHGSDVQSMSEDFIDDHFIKGMSVVVRHNGNVVYSRGVGQADSSNNRDSHRDTVYRLASISKGITGTLAFLLESDNQIRMNRPVRTMLPNLPSRHRYPLRDLLTSRSRVRHYIDSDPVNSLGQVSAREAVEEFMDDELVPFNRNDFPYSTHGYTIFSAALEQVTGTSLCQHLRQKISNPFNLNSLRCENRGLTNANRAHTYNHQTNLSGNSYIRRMNPDNLSWKYAGGGMEATAMDLARFGDLLQQHQILSEADLTTMITPPTNDWWDENFGYGWRNLMDFSLPYFRMNGRQRGALSTLIVYPENNITVVVMTNTRAPSGTPITRFARDIAELIVNN